MNGIEKHYFYSNDLQESIRDAEFAALFKLALKDGRLIPFEINVFLRGGATAKGDMFEIAEQSSIGVELLVFNTLEQKQEYQNN